LRRHASQMQTARNTTSKVVMMAAAIANALFLVAF
jgi:hypothetical protein